MEHMVCIWMVWHPGHFHDHVFYIKPYGWKDLHCQQFFVVFFSVCFPPLLKLRVRQPFPQYMLIFSFISTALFWLLCDMRCAYWTMTIYTLIIHLSMYLHKYRYPFYDWSIIIIMNSRENRASGQWLWWFCAKGKCNDNGMVVAWWWLWKIGAEK